MSKPVVAFGALGGTISMTRDSAADGIKPTLGAGDLIADLGAYAGVDIRATTLSRMGSSSLRESNVIEALAWAEEQIDQGACAAVLSQGTDTLEETAWLLDLWWRRPEPLVLVAAMRGPQAPGAEGPANLATALVAAAATSARSRGVLVAMNDTLHGARWVTKGNTTRPDAFVSPSSGPVGFVAEQRVHWFAPPAPRRAPLSVPDLGGDGEPAWVPVIWFHLGDTGRLARSAVEGGAGALVVAASGAGHVSEACSDALADLAKVVPVVLCSRTGSGPVFERTYGYQGAEMDLLGRGLISGGWLAPLKARLLLWTLVASGSAAADVATAFRHHATTGVETGVESP